MGSKRIKILVVLLAAIAIAAGLFYRPRQYQLDRTKYELISLHKPEYRSSYISGVNRFGVSIGRIEYSDRKTEFVKWYPDGSFEPIFSPDDINVDAYVNVEPRGINDKGDIVGYYQNRKEQMVHDSFCWDTIRGFRTLSVYDAFQFKFSDPKFINSQGQIAGIMAMNSPFKCAVFFYDPIDGLCDIGSLGESYVILKGMNEGGAIVGSSRISGNATHAFLWTRRDGMKDIHSAVAPQTVSTQAFAISYDGWILVQATDHKRNNQIIGYHPEKGIGHSCSFGEWISYAMPVGQSNRFVYRSVRPSWDIVRIRIRPTVHHNWILDFGCEPVLVAPKVMADQSWSIYGMTDQGLIVGSLNKTINKGIPQSGVEPFILRPIQTPDPDGK